MIIILLFLVPIVSMWQTICHKHIPCQKIDVGIVEGDFNLAIANTSQSHVFITATLDSRNLAILPHFVKYYVSFGVPVKNFLLIVQSRNQTNTLSRALDTVKRLGANAVSWIGPFSALTNLYHKMRLLEPLSDRHWLIYTDIDEFIEFPVPITSFIQMVQNDGARAVRGFFVDRVARSGLLTEIRDSPSIELQYPCRCNVTGNLMSLISTKVVLVRGDLRADNGHHHLLDKSWFKLNHLDIPKGIGFSAKFYAKTLTISHFKWTSEILAILQERMNYYSHNLTGVRCCTSLQRFVDTYITHGRIQTEIYCISCGA